MKRQQIVRGVTAAGLLGLAIWAVLSSQAQDVDQKVLDDEKQRMQVIEKVKPAVVAVFSPGGQGGGSGVLISADGYALTNFHVVAGMMRLPKPVMQCGLPDGGYYHAIVVGVDKVGDVALIKLLPNKPGAKFPFAPMGNSDEVKEGDWSLAMGNPFLLATDFNPTVTFGLVSGVHRYQYPAGTLLEYTDCIQIDTSINPGNSGGPLFNMKGEIIGINGRGSFDKRSRINSGVGYAISINQIRNFMGHLRAGIDVDHATLGAEVRSEKEEGDLGKLMVVNVLEEAADVGRRGLRVDDQLWKFGFDSRLLSSVNQYKNVLGIYPKGWRVPLVYRRDNREVEILARLMGVQKQEQGGPGPKPGPGPGPRPGPRPGPGPVTKPSPADKLFKAKKGYANYYFNELEQNRLLAAFQKKFNAKKVTGDWVITAAGRLKEQKNSTTANFYLVEVKEKSGKTTVPVIKMKMGDTDYTVEPEKTEQQPGELKEPTDSGGLLLALFLYKEFLTKGKNAFKECHHGGYEPLYPPAANGSAPKSLADLRVDCEVLVTQTSAYYGKWYFSRKDQNLVGLEVRLQEDEDPCEVYFSNYKKFNGQNLPGRMDVRFGNEHYGTFIMQKYTMAGK